MLKLTAPQKAAMEKAISSRSKSVWSSKTSLRVLRNLEKKGLLSACNLDLHWKNNRQIVEFALVEPTPPFC